MLKQVPVTSDCLAIVLKPNTDNSGNANTVKDNGFRIFQEFREENRSSFWNPALVESVSNLEFVGFVKPGTFFVSGSQIHLECLRGAWARRVLKPPMGFTIKTVGDIGGIEMQEVPQTQFVPLPEALCLIVSSMNRCGQGATIDCIITELKEQYPGMAIPKQEVLGSTLGALIAEGKLYCIGDCYFVTNPLMLQQYQMAQFFRRPQMLWTNEEALFLLHSHKETKAQELCSRECQTGASIVNGQAPYVPKKRNQASEAKPVKTQVTSTAAYQQKPTGSGQDQSSGNQQATKNQSTAPARIAPSYNNQCNERQKRTGLWKRLFGRSRSKQGKTMQENDPQVQPCSGVPKTASQKSIIQAANPSSECRAPQLATFCAQFPPPEWLHDPRFLKMAAEQAKREQNIHHHPYVPGFFKAATKKPVALASSKDPAITSKEFGKVKDALTMDRRQSLWTDIDPAQAQIVVQRRGKNGLRGTSHRYTTCPENLQNNAEKFCATPVAQNSARENRINRISKYLSSSSECLVPLPPTAFLAGAKHSNLRHHRTTPKYRQHGSSRHYRRSTPWTGFAGDLNLGDLSVSEPFKEHGSDSALETGDDLRTKRYYEAELGNIYKHNHQRRHAAGKQHTKYKNYGPLLPDFLMNLNQQLAPHYVIEDDLELLEYSDPLGGRTSTPTQSQQATPVKCLKQDRTPLVTPEKNSPIYMVPKATAKINPQMSTATPKLVMTTKTERLAKVALEVNTEGLELANKEDQHSESEELNLAELKQLSLSSPDSQKVDSAFSSSPIVTDMSSSASSDRSSSNKFSSLSSGSVDQSPLPMQGDVRIANKDRDPKDPNTDSLDHTYVNLPTMTKVSADNNNSSLDSTKFENSKFDEMQSFEIEGAEAKQSSSLTASSAVDGTKPASEQRTTEATVEEATRVEAPVENCSSKKLVREFWAQQQANTICQDSKAEPVSAKTVVVAEKSSKPVKYASQYVSAV